MAGTVRDLFLAVRVVDRATGPLRRVSNDLRRMQAGGAGGAAAQRTRLIAQQQASVVKQQRLISNIESATTATGAKRLALNQRILTQRDAEQRALSKIERSQRAITANQLTQGRAASRVADIQRQPDIDAAERRRLQTRLRLARTSQRDLLAQERTLGNARRDAEAALANLTNVRFRTSTNIHQVEQQITANLAAQEASRARFSKMVSAEVPAPAMARMARGPLPDEAGARAALLRHKSLLQQEAVLQRRLAEAQTALATMPQQEARATTAVNRAQNAITRNKTAQLASTQKIAALEQQVARTPTRARSALALQKDLQAAQIAYQDLITKQSTLQRDLRTAENARTRLHVSNQRIIADEQKLAQQTATWRNELQTTQGRISTVSNRIAQLNTIEQAYLSQENLARWQGRARVVEHLGHALSLVGLAATAAFGLAARAAANFSTQATLAATQARPPGAPPARTAQISTAIQRVVLRQMREFPAAADEMNKAIYDIFSGTNVQNIGRASQLLRIFNMEAVAGGTDLDTMVQAGITLYNNFPRQFSNATVAGNKFFAMVRYGRGTAEQFATALNPIIPIAKQAGQSFDDVSTTLAFLSRQSRDVTQNAQGYARVLLLLARPEVRAGFDKLGISVTDNHGRIRNLLDIVTELRKRVKLTPVEAITFFKRISESATGRGTAGTIQGQRVWARLVEGAKQYRVVSRQVLRDQNEFTRAFAAQRATPGVQWAVFTNQLRALVIELGTQAIPAFAKIGQYIERAIHWFDSLTPHTKRMIGYFGAFAAVGTLVGGVLLTIVGGVASLILTLRLLMGARGITALESAAEGGARGLGVLGSEAGFISIKLALLLGSAGALIYVFNRWPGTFHVVTGLVQRLTTAFGGLQQMLEFFSIGLLVRRLAISRGLLGALGADALATMGKVARLRSSLLLLGRIGLITIGIELLIDSKFRGRVGDFIHGRMGWQRSIDEGLARARNYLSRHTFGLTAPQVQLPSVRREQDAQFAAMQANMERRRRQLALIPVRQEERQMARRMGFNLPQRHVLLDRLVATMQRLRRLSAEGGPPGIIGPSNTDAANRYAAALQRVHARLVLIKGATRAQQFKALVDTAEQLGATKITPSFQTLFHNLVRARMLANAAQRALQLHPTAENSRKAIAAWNKFFAAQAALQQNATAEQVKSANKVVSGLTTAQKQQLDKQKQDFQSTIDSVQQMYDNLLQQNQNIFGQLFQGPQSALIEFRRSWGVAPRPIDLLKDIRGQVFQFQRFERMLNRLRRRGAPPELISQLQQLGPSALPEIAVLARMQPGQWKAYLTAFKAGQRLIKQQTMKDLNEQLALYRKFGKNVGEAIRKGIADEAPGLRNEIRALVLKMFPSLRPHVAAAHQASTPRQQQQRQQQHRHTHNHRHRHDHRHRHEHRHRTSTHYGGRQFQGTTGGGTTEHHTHYHDHTSIKMDGHESLESVLAKHRNRLRNRPRYGR